MELSVDLGRNDISFLLLSMRGEDAGRGSRAASHETTGAPASKKLAREAKPGLPRAPAPVAAEAGRHTQAVRQRRRHAVAERRVPRVRPAFCNELRAERWLQFGQMTGGRSPPSHVPCMSSEARRADMLAYENKQIARNIMSVHGLRAQALVQERMAEARLAGDRAGSTAGKTSSPPSANCGKPAVNARSLTPDRRATGLASRRSPLALK